MGDRGRLAVHDVGFLATLGQLGKQLGTRRANGAVTRIDVALAAEAAFELQRLLRIEVPAQ
ncbi:hypothetical protein D3C77_756610 [compost metagenome]